MIHPITPLAVLKATSPRVTPRSQAGGRLRRRPRYKEKRRLRRDRLRRGKRPRPMPRGMASPEDTPSSIGTPTRGRYCSWGPSSTPEYGCQFHEEVDIRLGRVHVCALDAHLTTTCPEKWACAVSVYELVKVGNAMKGITTL